MDKQRNLQTNCNDSLEFNNAEKQEVTSRMDSTHEDSIKSNSSTSSSLKSCSPSEEAISKELNHDHSESKEHLLNPEEGNFESFHVPEKIIPSLNVPERIVLCLDTTNDCNEYKIGETVPIMLRKIIEIFLYNKLYINRQHQFALVLLKGQNVLWLKNFTSEPQEILHYFNDFNENKELNDHFDISTLFNTIEDHITVPDLLDSHLIPFYNVRIILLYNRSYCIPKFISGKDSYNKLRSSNYFTIDILYIQDEESENNKCKEIFQFLSELDNQSFIFKVTKNFNILCDNMAKLLAHPMQRPMQNLSSYKIPEIKTP